MSFYMYVQDMEAILQWMHFKTDKYVYRVPHVMYGSLCFVRVAVALLRMCMRNVRWMYLQFVSRRHVVCAC